MERRVEWVREAEMLDGAGKAERRSTVRIRRRADRRRRCLGGKTGGQGKVGFRVLTGVGDVVFCHVECLGG